MFGIRPWEVERLRPHELDAMRASLEPQHQEDDQPVSMGDAIEAAPVFDEGALPDPLRTPPRDLERLG